MPELRGSKLLICADAIAKSSIWGSPVTDDRGEQLEDFIVEHYLHVLNRGGEATFCGTRGRSFIDVTLVSRSMLRYRAGPKRNEFVNWVAAVCPELYERVSKKGHLYDVPLNHPS